MIVLICGGRDYADRSRVFGILDLIAKERRVHVLLEGGATGADMLAHEWARVRRVRVRTYWAEWTRPDGSVDKTAGPRRNQQMIDDGNPDLVVAFPGGVGTADMVRRARKAGIPVRSV